VHRAIMRGEACLGTSKPARFNVGPPSAASFDRALLAVTANCCCPTRLEARSWLETAGYPANAGSDGRGRGATTDVPGDPDVDRPTAGAAGTNVTGR
jgi:hypothetical protein